MERLSFTLGVVVAILIIVSGMTNYISAQEPQSEGFNTLEQRVRDVEIKGDTIYLLLGDIALKLQITIGFENLEGSGKGCQLKGRLIFRTGEMTIRQILEYVENRSIDCAWEERQGAVDFHSRSASRRLATQDVANFRIPLGTTRRDIKSLILASTEANNLLEGPEYITFLVDPMTDDHPISQAFSLQPGTYELQDILNTIAKESSSKYWALVRWKASDSAILLAL